MTITSSYIIETERLKLSLIQQNDLEAVFETMNSKETCDIISFLTWPLTRGQAQAWCERSIQGLKTQKEFLFIAREKENASPVGCICLFLSQHVGEAEVGYWVSKTKQGQKYAQEMLTAILHFGFNTLSVKKIIATAAKRNPISLKILQKHGFKIIGEKVLPTAKGEDLVCDLLMKEEYI